jgi:hypothetical protein
VLDHSCVNFTPKLRVPKAFGVEPIFTVSPDDVLPNQTVGVLVVNVSAQNPVGNSVSGGALGGVFATSINAALLKAQRPCASHPAVGT